MRLKPLNDTIIVEPDPIEKYEGLIELPDKNTEEKISNYATVVSWGDACIYPHYVGQRVIMDKFFDKPFNFEFQGKKLRFIKEHYLHAVVE